MLPVLDQLINKGGAMASDTRQRLLDAARDTVLDQGIAGVSSRSIARRAEANPALIFYHFDTLDSLLATAARQLAETRASAYAQRLSSVETFTDLVAAARALHHEERAAGTLTLLTQLIAGARTHPHLLPTLQDNFELLATQVSRTIARLLRDTPLDGLVDPEGLGRSISGGFLGLELIDTLSPGHDPGLFTELDTLAALVDTVLEGGTLQRSMLRRRLRSHTGNEAP